MKFFDFHHHHSAEEFGIFNLHFNENKPAFPFSAGIHPHIISGNMEEKFLWLNEITKDKNCVAIGECGLDGIIAIEEKLQEEIFLRQIFLANEIKKPLIIHCIKRFSRLVYFQKFAKVPMIVHGFNKRKTIGVDLQKHEFWLSFGKSVLYNVNLQEFLKEFPTEKLFLETDSADFDIEILYEKVASIKNLKVEELTQMVQENLRKIQISL